MIEQTEMVVDQWVYLPPPDPSIAPGALNFDLSLEVMRKSAPGKKGLACRLTCRVLHHNDAILLYVAQDSYVIDLHDHVDKNEVQRMLQNSFDKFKEKYDFRKLGTVLHEIPMKELDVKGLDINGIVALLA